MACSPAGAQVWVVWGVQCGGQGFGGMVAKGVGGGGVSASEGPGVVLPQVGRGHTEGLEGLEARLAAQGPLESRVSSRADRNTTFLT